MILGYIFTFLLVASFVGMIALSVGAMRESARSTNSLSNAKQIVMGCKLYARDHGGEFPASLDELIPQYLHDPAVLISPFQKDKNATGYEYTPGLTEKAPPETIIVRDAFLSGRKKRAVARVDGSGEILREQ